VKRLAAIIIIALAGVPLWSQGVPITGQVISSFGQPVPGAQIRVCNVTSSGSPCSPLTSLYYDYALSQVAPNPGSADANGNYLYFAPALSGIPGLYLVQVYPVAGGQPYDYVVNGGGVGGGGSPGLPNTAVQVGVNGVFTGYSTLLYTPSGGLQIGNPIVGVPLFNVDFGGNVTACSVNGIADPTCPTFAGGADPSGATDSTAAFVAAVATGLPVSLPQGTFKFSGQIHLTAFGQSFVGAGRGLTILNYLPPNLGTSYCDVPTSGNPAPHGILALNMSGNNETVNDLTVQGVQGVICPFVGIAASGTNDTIERNNVYSTYGMAIDALSSTKVRVLNNDIENFYYGVHTGASTGALVQGNTLVGGWSTGGQIPPWEVSGDVATVTATGSGYTTASGVAPTILTGSCSGTIGTYNITASGGAILPFSSYTATRPSGCSQGTTASVPGGAGGVITISSTVGSTYWDCSINEGATGARITNNEISDCGQSGVYFGGGNSDTSDNVISNNHVTHVRNYGLDFGVSTNGDTITHFAATGNVVTDNNQGNCHFVGVQNSTLGPNDCEETSGYTAYWGADAAPSGQNMNDFFGSSSVNAALIDDTLCGSTLAVYDTSIYNAIKFQNNGGSNVQFQGCNVVVGVISTPGATPLTIGTSPTILGSMPDLTYPLFSSGSAGWQLLGTWTGYSTGDVLKLVFNTGTSVAGASGEQSEEKYEVRLGNATTTPNLTGASLLVTLPQMDGTYPIPTVTAVQHSGSASAANEIWDIYISQTSFNIGTYTVSGMSALDQWQPIGTAASNPGTASTTVLPSNPLGSVVLTTLPNTFNGVTNSQKFETATSGDRGAISILDTTGTPAALIGVNLPTSSLFTFDIFSPSSLALNAGTSGGQVAIGNATPTFLTLFQATDFRWSNGTYFATLAPPALGTIGGTTQWNLPPCASGGCTDYLGKGLPIPDGTATFAAGTNVTSCLALSGYPAPTNTRGDLQIIGSAATAGQTICTVSFSASLIPVPSCVVTQNGGAVLYGIGWGAASNTSFTITSDVALSTGTVNVHYECGP
jgi:hypothetical protein